MVFMSTVAKTRARNRLRPEKSKEAPIPGASATLYRPLCVVRVQMCYIHLALDAVRTESPEHTNIAADGTDAGRRRSNALTSGSFPEDEPIDDVHAVL